jgi:eukaryotic-like serine/threonine-protein kinase
MAETKIEAPQQACPSCGTAVSVGDVEPLARVACPKCGESFRVATLFDHFEILETLGVGGMGSVYKARDTRLDRFVALKLLRRELSVNPEEAARLEQEARVTAAVNHPNVVQVYSTGTAHGQLYLVMELVDHGSLDDLMAQQTRVPEAQVLETGIQVAKGLQAAHEKGLIHRDIKPANILFADPQTAKIGDFGLAVAAGGQQAEAQSEIWGTPYYVAPERLNNAPEDFRSDIYSLGATLFHVLAGRPPIDGETTSASELRMLKAISPDLRRVAPDVSRETARLVNRMLAPDPAHRFTSYAQLVDQLQRAQRALPGANGGAKRRRTMLYAGAGVVLLLLAAAGYFFFAHKPAQQVTAVQAPTPTPTPDNTAALQRRYDEARRQLLDGKHDAAATALTKLATEAQNRQPLVSWIQMHRGLASLLQGKTAPAREAFRDLGKLGEFGKAKGDAELARFFTEAGQLLAAPGPIRGPAAEVNPKSPDAFGVKNWQIGEFDEAAAHFERFMATDSTGDFAWINDYKPIARTFLDDHRIYAEWKQLPQRPNAPAEMRSNAEKIRALAGKVKTRGALVEALNTEAKRLSTELAEREKAEKKERDAQKARLLEKETPIWTSALEAARAQIATYAFGDALKTIESAPVTEESLKQAQATERKRIELLIAWQRRLIEDINAGRFTAPVSVGATNYTGAASADATAVVLKLPPYGSAKVDWTKLPPPTLLGMSATLIPGTADAADRQWLAAVFAHATGQTEETKRLSDAAVTAKPALKADLGLLKTPPAGSR